MNRILYVFVLAFFVMAASCNKEADNSGTSPTAPGNFQPIKANSTWDYEIANLVTGINSVFQLKATSKDTTANGRTYRVFTNSVGPNEYFNVTNEFHYQFGRFDALNTVLDLLYLRSDLAVNGTWDETKTINISGTPLNVKFTYTIAEKGIVYTVGSKLYQKVTRVHVVLSAPGVPIASQDINFYYAENIGRIYSKVVLVVPLAGVNSSTETRLTAYSIAP
jgi:hypothetical protein